MEESLLKTHFLGRDGFRWWIGQIPPLNPEMEKQLNGGGWGNRYPVRIMGYHSYNKNELPDEDLPWANVILPPGIGTGSAHILKTVKFAPGDTVVGFFLDGDNAQLPVIFGSIGNTQYKIFDADETVAFASFTGYNKYIKKPDATVLKPNESNESNASSSETPRFLGPADAKNLTNNASMASAVGTKISLPCGQSGNAAILNKVQTSIEQFIYSIKNLKAQVDMGLEYAKEWMQNEIKYRAEQLSGLLSGFVGGIMNGIYETLIPILNKALNVLYKTVKSVLTPIIGGIAAELAAIAALNAMVGPIQALQNQLPCLINQVIESLVSISVDILTSISDNVINFVDCVSDQFIGAVTNGVFNQILDGLNPLLAVMETTQAGILFQLLPGFDLENDVLRPISNQEGIASTVVEGLSDVFVCNKPSQQSKYGACEYRIGSGPSKKKELDITKIVQDANTAKAISTVAGGTLSDVATIYGAFTVFTEEIAIPDFSSAFGECYAGVPQFCNPPTINIFGGEGIGATAEPIFGLGVLGNNNKTNGSIIGFKLTNPGQNYVFPPFVEVVDNCGQGYGAKAKVIMNTDGTIKAIVPKNEKTIGENYITDEEPTVEKQIASTIPVLPGSGYEEGDTITDNLGNEYTPTIVNGGIVKATPINNPKVTELPVITVNSDTGSGAIIVPILEEVPDSVAIVTKPGEVQSVIDCIV